VLVSSARAGVSLSVPLMILCGRVVSTTRCLIQGAASQHTGSDAARIGTDAAALINASSSLSAGEAPVKIVAHRVRYRVIYHAAIGANTTVATHMLRAQVFALAGNMPTD
jgi:hypothetical protein